MLGPCGLLLLAATALAETPTTLADPSGAWRAETDDRGGLRSLEFPRSNAWVRAAFRTDAHRGPCWQVEEGGGWQDIELRAKTGEPHAFTGQRGDLSFGLRYEGVGARLGLLASVSNSGTTARSGLRAGLRLGLDLERSPATDWRTVPVPTLLRCEPTHFWGVFMSPLGQILGIGSPDPVAAWHLDEVPGTNRLRTASLDLLSPPPLPPHHPQAQHALAPGATKMWTIYLEDIPHLGDVRPRLAAGCRGPIVAADLSTVEPTGRAVLRAYGPNPVSGKIRTSDGREMILAFSGDGPDRWTTHVRMGAEPERYDVQVRDSRGREAWTTLAIRHPWSWYLKQLVPRPPEINPLLGDARTLLSVMARERPLARTSAVWRASLAAHYAEVNGVLNNLLADGMPVLEDGRLAGNCAQLALFAMWTTNDVERSVYTQAASDLLALDRCFSPLLAPDHRITESTAARIRGAWYLYRLTGQESLLQQAYDQLGSAVQQMEGAPEMAECLREVAAGVCHVVERPGSNFVAYNGSVRLDAEVLIVEPAEACVTSVHLNLRGPRTVRVMLAGKKIERRLERTGWLGRVPSL